MKPARRARLLGALAAVVVLAGCGQKGPLTLPQGAAPPPAQPSQESSRTSDDEESEQE